MKERIKNSFLFLTVIGCEYSLSINFLVGIVACVLTYNLWKWGDCWLLVIALSGCAPCNPNPVYAQGSSNF